MEMHARPNLAPFDVGEFFCSRFPGKWPSRRPAASFSLCADVSDCLLDLYRFRIFAQSFGSIKDESSAEAFKQC